MSNIIECQGIGKVYGEGAHSVRALSDVHLTIAKGEMMAIMGRSGSGKSTMMNIIGLLDQPTEGALLLDGQEMSHLSAEDSAIYRNQMIGFVFQCYHLLPKMQVRDNIGLPLWYRGTEQSVVDEKVEALLVDLGLESYSQAYPNQLSGGQQQRVAIARALVGEPSILLADEPTGALDTETGEMIMALLMRMNKEKGASVVVITHDPEVGESCERVVRLVDGKVVS